MNTPLKLATLAAVLLSASVSAKDLGTWGNLFEPAEQDMLALIQ